MLRGNTGASVFRDPDALGSFVEFIEFLRPYVSSFADEASRYKGKANIVRTVCQSILYLNPHKPGDSWSHDFLKWVESRTEEEDALAYSIAEGILKQLSGGMSLAVMSSYLVGRFQMKDAGKSMVLSNMTSFLKCVHDNWKREPSLFYAVGVMNPG